MLRILWREYVINEEVIKEKGNEGYSNYNDIFAISGTYEERWLRKLNTE